VREPSDDGFTWLYDQSLGYTPLVHGYTTRCYPNASAHHQETQEWLCVHDRGYTSHIVFMRGYILHVYRQGPRTT